MKWKLNKQPIIAITIMIYACSFHGTDIKAIAWASNQSNKQHTQQSAHQSQPTRAAYNPNAGEKGPQRLIGEVPTSPLQIETSWSPRRSPLQSTAHDYDEQTYKQEKKYKNKYKNKSKKKQQKNIGEEIGVSVTIIEN
jgi:hypothetical protein